MACWHQCLQQKKFSAQTTTDTIKTEVVTLRDKISGVEERLATAEGDLAKLTKIKLSGYIQAQWQHFEASNAYPSIFYAPQSTY